MTGAFVVGPLVAVVAVIARVIYRSRQRRSHPRLKIMRRSFPCPSRRSIPW